jgi:hypothetical protein
MSDYIAWRFGNIGLITPDGVKDGPHGVPSGSTFTLEVNSIAQILIAKEFVLDIRLKSLLVLEDMLLDNVDVKFVKYSSNGKDFGALVVDID